MRKWYPWLLVGLTFGFSAAMYSRLPEQIPVHWDAAGQVNGWSSRTWGAWMMPLGILVMAIVLPRLPAIDPKRTNYDKFRPSYDLAINATITLVAVLHVAMLGAGAGWPVPMGRLAPVTIGALFVILGNVLPRARPNWMFGIRTPWTLTNDRVWERTHRLAGTLMVIAGLVLFASAFLKPSAMGVVIVGSAIVASVVPFAYSYFAWRQETSRVQNS